MPAMPAALRWLLDLLPTNPIVVRIVQGGSRRLRHMYIRSGYLAALIIVFLIVLLQGSSSDLEISALAVQGSSAFAMLSYLQIGLICLLTPVFMAGAIAQESNPRTWDILLTTPLSAIQMVLGNIFGRLFFVLALLAASLPLVALTQYFGGVPGRSVLLSYAIAACAALLVGAIAVALSVSRLAGKRAVFAFYISVVTYLGVTWAIDLGLRGAAGGVTVMTPLNPFLALTALLNPTGYPRPQGLELETLSSIKRLWFGNPVLAWCLISGGLSVALIAASSITVRNVGTKGGVPLHKRLLKRQGSTQTTRPAKTVSKNPIAWREASARQATLPKIIARWAFVALGVLWGIATIIYFHNGGMASSDLRFVLAATIWTEVIVIVLVAINVSATAISREREDGTLDIILTTPITPKDYLNGKLRGLVTYLLPMLAVPLLTLAIGAAYTLMTGTTVAARLANTAGAPVVNGPLVLPEAALLAPLAMIPFLAFVVMVGLQWSLKSKGTIGSVIGSVGVIGAVAGVVGLCAWQAASGLTAVGPILAPMTPVTLTHAVLNPAIAMESTVDAGAAMPLINARVALAIGVVVTFATYFAIVGALRSALVRTFDMTTRRLAGRG